MQPKHSIPTIALILLAIVIFSFQTPTQNMSYTNDDYAAAWKKIDSLDKKGLPESAQKEVDALYTRAKNDENAPQIVKCLLYKSRYIAQLNEDGMATAVAALQKETESTTFPAQPVLQSILAELYMRLLRPKPMEISRPYHDSRKQAR